MRRDAQVAISYRLSLILELFFGLSDLLFYFFVSRTFHGVTGSGLGAAPTYFAFAVVGTSLGAVLGATSASAGHRVREEQLTGTFEVFLASPATSLELCIGVVGFPFAFALLRAAVYIAIASLVLNLDVSHVNWGGLLLILLVTGASVAPIGILAGAAALVVKRGHILASTGVYVMTVLAGMAFPVSVLPRWLQWVSAAIPLRYAFDGARAAFFAGSGWSKDVFVLVATAVVLWPVALLAFNWALAISRRRASLAEY